MKIAAILQLVAYRVAGMQAEMHMVAAAADVKLVAAAVAVEQVAAAALDVAAVLLADS